MENLTIRWQRLVESGETCPRCGDTGQNIREAAATLTKVLAPLGITVSLQEGVIPLVDFEQAPLESNRIMIGGRSLEDWLGGATGQSACCDVCGPNDCRTVTVDGTSYETIPADLVIRAGLLAANAVLAAPDLQPAGCCGPTVLPSSIPVGRSKVPESGEASCCGE